MVCEFHLNKAVIKKNDGLGDQQRREMLNIMLSGKGRF